MTDITDTQPAALAGAVTISEGPPLQTLLDPAERALAAAREIRIDSDAVAEYVTTQIRELDARRNALEAERKSITGPLDQAKARIMDKYRRPVGMLEQASTALRGEVVRWNNERERARLEEQRRRDEQARQEREATERKAAEARAKAEAEAAAKRREAEAAAAAGRAAEAEKLRRSAEATEARGESRAARLEETAAATPAAVVLPAVKSPAGVSIAYRYTAECEDVLALAAFVIANPMFRSLIQANPTELNRQATSLRDAFAIPGCRLDRKPTTVVRKAGS